MISLQDFSYRYQGSEKQALQDINLEVSEGDFVLLTGPSGCGKTTLALALAGFLFSQYQGEYSGEIKINGRDPAREPIYSIADLVALVQQNPENQFCTLTVEDEIAFGLENRLVPREKIEEQLAWALKAVGASQLRDRELFSLSGGEKQKIALAAILAANPRVIIFDEPTSNLDPVATREIFEVILDLQKRVNLTVLVIEHKLDFLSSAGPKLIRMAEGRIVREAPRQSGTLKLNKPAFARTPTQPLLEVKNLKTGYFEQSVLSGVDFQLYPGEIASLLGDNGSGKSTLLLSLLKMVPLTGGSVHFMGKDLEEYETRELGRDLGLVFQNPDHQIFAPTVWQEAVLGAINFQLDPDVFERRAHALLEQAGLEERLHDHPYRLSYGEKRRLNLISILVYQPRLLLLDEVFIGQDQENADYLMRLLVDYVEEGNSVLLVNHNPAYYPLISTRLLFLEGGALAVDLPITKGLQKLKTIGKLAYLPGGFS